MREKYQLTKKRFIILDIESSKDLVIIKEMNNEFDKQKKKDRTFHKYTTSLDMLKEQINFDIADEGSESDWFVEHRKQEVLKAIESLPPKQKLVIIEHFYNKKSFRTIAKENNRAISTIMENYQLALKNLRENLIEFQEMYITR